MNSTLTYANAYANWMGIALRARQRWGDDLQMRWAGKPEFRDVIMDCSLYLSRWRAEVEAPQPELVPGSMVFCGLPVAVQPMRDTFADLEVISPDGEVLEAIPACL